MIIAHIQQASRYLNLHPLFPAVWTWLQETAWTTLAEGTHAHPHLPLRAIVNRYFTRKFSEVRWEAHRRHIDWQWLMLGEEKVGYAPLSEAVPFEDPYDTERDVQWFRPGSQLCDLRTGQFMLLFPEDVHAPGIEHMEGVPIEVFKIVVKIPVT
ncbi:MAG: hypothetical protein KatS3mg113_1109 [Planctomycetaceae bacterium]|nr:MAG: hypothetical protein KatS3mg113_1109 [Planctomycetaceae bacterium]